MNREIYHNTEIYTELIAVKGWPVPQLLGHLEKWDEKEQKWTVVTKGTPVYSDCSNADLENNNPLLDTARKEVRLMCYNGLLEKLRK